MASDAFIDIAINRDSLEPLPVEEPLDHLIHRDVCSDGVANGFSESRGHPVYAVKLPSTSISASVGELAPAAQTSNHRHAYESLVYVLEGEGWTILEGERLEWRAGDAFYVPPWNWHRHVAGPRQRVRYLTTTNLPLLHKLGQTVLRQEGSD
jgi:quercetin dioxygenase-like cupin family protein